MGILKVLSWYKTFVQTKHIPITDNVNVSSLFIDLDTIIHESAQKIYKYGVYSSGEMPDEVPGVLNEQIISDVIQTLSEYIIGIKAQKVLFICSNGVTPDAKLYYEKCMRYKSSSINTNGFDVSAISPGTPFMRKLSEKVNRFIDSNERILPSKTIYSSDMIPGEVKQKMIEVIRGSTLPKNIDDELIVISNDPGMIPLLMTSAINRVYLKMKTFRLPRTRRKGEPINVKYISTEENISIRHIIEEVHKSMARKDIQVEGYDYIIRDFVLILNLFGNEYIPSIPSLRDQNRDSFDSIFKAYKSISPPLTQQTGDIIWERFKQFLDKLSENEESLLSKFGKSDNENDVDTIVSKSTATNIKIEEDIRKEIIYSYEFDYQKFRSMWYSNILSPQLYKRNDKTMRSFIEDSYRNKEIMPFNREQITNLCVEYLRGIAWCNEYAMQGYKRIDLSWYYPHYYAPLISDLVRTLDVNPSISGYETCGRKFLNPLAYLMSVVPISSFNILPAMFLEVFGFRYNKGVGYMYPKSFNIQKDDNYRGDIWQGVMLIPIPNSDEITEWISTLDIPKYVVEFFNIGSEKVKTVIVRGETKQRESSIASESTILGNITTTQRRFVVVEKDDDVEKEGEIEF